MENSKKKKSHDIFVTVDKVPVCLDGVTKDTTCDDVIKRLLNKGLVPAKEEPENLALFEAHKGHEKQLTGKTKVLKHCRAWGTNRKVEFLLKIVKSSAPNCVDPKSANLKRNLVRNEKMNKNLAPKKVSTKGQNRRLSLHMTSEMTKLQGIQETKEEFFRAQEDLDPIHNGDIGDYIKGIYFDDADDDSMDEFFSCVDTDNMGDFLKFCSSVTSKELDRCSRRESVIGIPMSSREIPLFSSRADPAGSRLSLGPANDKKVKLAFRKSLRDRSGNRRQSVPAYCHSVQDIAREQSERRKSINAKSLEITQQKDVKRGLKRSNAMRLITGSPMLKPKKLKGVENSECFARNDRRQSISFPIRANGRQGLLRTPAKFNSLEDRCRFYWDRNLDSDCDTSFEEDADLSTPVFEEIGPDLEQCDKEDKNEVDTPVKQDPEVAPCLNVNKMPEVRLVDYSYSDIEYESDNSLDHGFYGLDEDNEVNIPRKKFVEYDSDSDTGLSSLGSDCGDPIHEVMETSL